MSILAIRKLVFGGMTAKEFAAIAGANQSTISRWEKGSIFPDIRALKKIRDEAIRRGLKWEDSFFFMTEEEVALRVKALLNDPGVGRTDTSLE